MPAAGFANAPSNNFDLRITAVVPPGALPGPITVLTPHGNVTSTASFQPLPPSLSLRFDRSSRAELSWGATSGLFVPEHSDNLVQWQTLEYEAEVGAEGTTLLLPIALQKTGFFRLRTKP